LYNIWSDLVRDAGVADGGRLSGIMVHGTSGAQIDDVVLCPPAAVKDRLATLASGGGGRRTIPERVFLARALRNDADTAAAILVRAVIGKWVHARGRRDVEDADEKRVWAVIDNHLNAVGQPATATVTAGARQIADTHIKPPVAHNGAADVVRKAMAQIVRQLDGRQVIIMGGSPLAS
jgi:hypothetical protein